jgi:hypothetical protein
MDRGSAALRPVLAGVAEPAGARRLVLAALPVVVVLALLLPPFSLWTRLTTLGYTPLRPGTDVSVPAAGARASLEVRRRAIRRTARVHLAALADHPRELDRLPAGQVPFGPVFRLDLRGPRPQAARLVAGLPISRADQPFVDPYGWDGQRWRWLRSRFATDTRIQVELPWEQFDTRLIAFTRPTQGSTAVSAVLLPPPAAAPAAVAELPVLEMRAYHLDRDDGSVSGRAFPIPSRQARVYGVLDNRQGQRLRTDLANNILIRPESRRRHREAIGELAQRDELAGVVLDYRGIDIDLQPIYADWLARLADDLHRDGRELVVTVPMPRQTASGWDEAPFSWSRLGSAVDGLRVLLPGDAPLETEALDSLLRWALGSVDRRRLQLAVPVQGRDIVGQEAMLVGYGTALAPILDMARADAPDRITPGSETTIDLPTIRAAGLGRDAATGMWRFAYWDANRREHTVWLNDAAGLRPAFEIAARYRLSQVVLDGVEAGLDPALWSMVKSFIATGRPIVPTVSYRLQWQLIDSNGEIVHEALQPLTESTFVVRAPDRQGSYRLSVNLVTEEGRLAAVGSAAEVRVAPPPPPPPTPTPLTIILAPTPETVITAPAPRDEAEIARTPVRVSQAADTATPSPRDGVVTFATAALRAGPGTDFDLISDLRVGERFSAEGRSTDGRWLYLRLGGTGVEGWALAELVSVGLPVEALPVLLPQPTGPAGQARPTARATAAAGRP